MCLRRGSSASHLLTLTCNKHTGMLSPSLTCVQISQYRCEEFQYEHTETFPTFRGRRLNSHRQQATTPHVVYLNGGFLAVKSFVQSIRPQ